MEKCIKTIDMFRKTREAHAERLTDMSHEEIERFFSRNSSRDDKPDTTHSGKPTSSR